MCSIMHTSYYVLCARALSSVLAQCITQRCIIIIIVDVFGEYYDVIIAQVFYRSPGINAFPLKSSCGQKPYRNLSAKVHVFEESHQNASAYQADITKGNLIRFGAARSALECSGQNRGTLRFYNMFVMRTEVMVYRFRITPLLELFLCNT